VVIEVSSRAPLRDGELEAIIQARELWPHPASCLLPKMRGFVVLNQVLEKVLGGSDAIGLQLFFAEGRKFTGKPQYRSARQQLAAGSARLRLGQSRSPYVPCFAPILRGCHFFPGKLGFQKRERYFAGADAVWGGPDLRTACGRHCRIRRWWI